MKVSKKVRYCGFIIIHGMPIFIDFKGKHETQIQIFNEV